MKRHQINIFTSKPGKTWASCSTCGLASKQGTKADAETWMVKHQDKVLNTPASKKQKQKKRPRFPRFHVYKQVMHSDRRVRH